MSGTGSDNGWLEAAIAWEVCASLHRHYCKGKDALFTTRQSDFVKHAEDARDRASHGQAPAEPAGPCAICGSDEPFTGTCGSGDPRALCKQPSTSPQAAQQAPAKLVEAVTKAILFEDTGSSEGWEENTNLGEAAIRVCDARNPPRCSYCHSATGAPLAAPPAMDGGEDAARYRWLREGNDAKHGAAWYVAVNLYGCEWDAAIDAARAAQKKGSTT